MFDKLTVVKKIDGKLAEIIHEDLPILSRVRELVVRSGGKRIRPLLHFYFSKILGYEKEEWIDVGAIGEMIHAASLLHDDVVDESDVRRGKPSANALFGNKAAILSGDYLLSCALEHISRLEKAVPVLVIFTGVVRMLSVGELIQMEKERDLELTLEDYHRVIHGKTGSLFGAMTESAALLSGRNPEECAEYRVFGEKLGAVFQKRDDFLDYFMDASKTGKPAFQDFERGLVTYPAILLRESLGEKDRFRMAELWAEESLRHSPEGIRLLQDLLERGGVRAKIANRIEDDLDELSAFLEKQPSDKKSYVKDIQKQIDQLRVGRIPV